MCIALTSEQWPFVMGIIFGAVIGVVGSFVASLTTSKYMVYRENQKDHFNDIHQEIILPLKTILGRLRNSNGTIKFDAISGEVDTEIIFSNVEEHVLFNDCFAIHFPQIEKAYDQLKKTILEQNKRYAEFEKNLSRQVTEKNSLPFFKGRSTKDKDRWVEERTIEKIKNNLISSIQGRQAALYSIEEYVILEKNTETGGKCYILCTPGEVQTDASSDIRDDLIALKNQLLIIQNKEENKKEAKEILDSARRIESDITNLKKRLDSLRYPYQLSQQRCKFCPSFLVILQGKKK